MRKVLMTAAVALGGLVTLFAVAGRGHYEWKGFLRASADQAVDEVTESLPEEIHDKKLSHELTQVKAELIDRQVAMNLSTRQCDGLHGEITALTGSTERRQRLLAEAYPVLKAAIDGQQATVKWANQNVSLAEFQKEVDELLAMQDRETRQLEIKRTGLARLEKSAAIKNELLSLLDKHLRRVLAGWRNQLARDGVRYTEMVNDFFVKLLRGGVSDFWNAESEEDLRKLVATVILNQVRDYFRGKQRGQRVLSEIAPFVEQRQRYYEERYETTYEDFIVHQLAQWRASGNAGLVLQADVLEDHYVGGVKWGDIARQRGVSDEALLKIRRAAMEQLRKKSDS